MRGAFFLGEKVIDALATLVEKKKKAGRAWGLAKSTNRTTMQPEGKGIKRTESIIREEKPQEGGGGVK